MPLKPIHVLLVAESPHMRYSLTRLLAPKDRVHIVGEASSIQHALRLSAIEPHVILLDLLLPTMGRVAAIQILRDRFLSAEIIALVTLHIDNLADEALQAGAIGCLSRDNLDANTLFKAIVFAYNGMPFNVPATTPPESHVPLPKSL